MKKGNRIELAYEWYNHVTGHWYVDYIPRPNMGINEGYTKTPLYPHEFVLFMSGNMTSKGTTISDWYEHWLTLKDEQNENGRAIS